MSKSNVDPYGVCSLRVIANLVLCRQCSKWIHGRRAGVIKLLQSHQEILHAENVKGILERQWIRKKSNMMKC